MNDAKVLYIVNPIAGAGRGRTRWTRFRERFRGQLPVGEEVFTGSPGAAVELARDGAERFDLLIAVGGDGTVREVAEGVLSSARREQAELGVVPLGTGNDFARELGIRTVEDASRALITGRARRKDVIRVVCTTEHGEEVRHALLFAAVGVISELVKQTTPRVKRYFGQRLSYPVGLARALRTYRGPSMTIECDGETHEDRFLFAGVSNTATAGGGMRLAPGAKANDGVLDVNLIHAIGRVHALFQIVRLCLGKHTTHPRVRYFGARRFSVRSGLPLEVAVDGDLTGLTPASFDVLTGALAFRTCAD